MAVRSAERISVESISVLGPVSRFSVPTTGNDAVSATVDGGRGAVRA